MCALGQNRLPIYFPDEVNTSGTEQAASLTPACCVGHNSVPGDCGSKVSHITAPAPVIFGIFTHQTVPTPTLGL